MEACCNTVAGWLQLQSHSTFEIFSLLMVFLSQGGTAASDFLTGVIAFEDGTAVLTWYTEGVWSDPNRGISDFAAVRLDQAGTEICRWQVTRVTRTHGLRAAIDRWDEVYITQTRIMLHKQTGCTWRVLFRHLQSVCSPITHATVRVAQKLSDDPHQMRYIPPTTEEEKT